MLKTNFTTLEEFFLGQEEPALSALKKLRKTIQSLIPDEEEYISYQIPTFKYRGKPLIGYGAFKKHYSLFIMSTKIGAKFAIEYPEHSIKGSTIQFKFDEEVPLKLLKKVIGERMMETDEYYEVKSKKK
jgi:uncharacterized protein YdhG (YjbR/CyaY superfamily)